MESDERSVHTVSDRYSHEVVNENIICELLENYAFMAMKNDDQLQTVQKQIGRVQGQMKDNIELVIQRQEDVEVLADKSSNLQASASQFSQVASRIREDQQLKQYKFYAGIFFGLVTIVVLVAFWKSPGKLLIAMLLVGAAAGLVFYMFHARKQNTIKLADSMSYSQQVDDPELGPIKE